jgi:tetratricopeptide (TPR) repeat protein
VNLKAGRNDSCPCGSGKKYKICCGRLTAGVELRHLVDLMDAGRFAELESKARGLLGTCPNLGAAWQLLGVALGKQNKDPLQALTRAVQCLPDDAVANLNLGNALGRLGRLDEAEGCFRRALFIRPDFAEAHNHLGDVQLQFGRFDDAVVSCRRALAINPELAEAHQNLGKVLTRLGRFDEAAASCSRALELRPQFADAHNTLGNALLKLARLDDALASFQRALQFSPTFAEARVNLANALRSIGRLDAAVAGYREALRIRPDFVSAHIELGTALRLQRRTAESEASCRNALELDPKSTAAFAVLAESRADEGRFAEAEELFQRVISIDPDSVEAWAGIARLRRMSVADGDWLAAAQRLAEQPHPPQRELSLRYAIGKYFDDIEDSENAFLNYKRANELAKRSGPAYDRTLMSRTVDLIIHSHDRNWVGETRQAANPSARPVFIVGMLRSGTTLAEQILASHPAIFGAGELTFWGTQSAAAIARASTAAAPGAAATGARPTKIEIEGAALARWSDDYLEHLQRLSPRAVRVVDKFPTNFLFLGLIHAALPRARIIHMRRNAIDTCLSIYFQQLEAANAYANDLDDLAHYYREYRRLMQHWRTVLPGDAMLEVPYEGLAQSLPVWSRRMLDFVDVPWDPRCLDFHQTVRSVVTASRWQVRQRISATSVNRWRRYERFVAPLKPLLELE